MEALACSLEEEGQEGQLMAHLAEREVGQPQKAPAGVDLLLLSMLPITDWQSGGTEGCDECPLCLGDYEVGEKIMRLPCLHGAHEECLSQWLGRCTQCLVCKLDVQECLSSMCD